MASTGETLSVVIGAQADPLIQGLKQAEAALNSFGRSTQDALNKVAGAAGILETLFGVGLTGGIADMIKSTVDHVGSLQEQADQLGINVEKFQELKFAAEQAGVGGDDFTQGLNRLSRQLGEAQAGVLKSQDVFTKWGIAIRDSQGNALDLNQVLAEVADRFQSITDPQLRSAAAMDLMGRSAFNMINFLSQGSAAMAEAEEKARSMGAVIGQDTVAKAKAAKDELAALSDVITANLETALIHVTPSAQRMADAFDRIRIAAAALRYLPETLGNPTKGIQDFASSLTGAGTPQQRAADLGDLPGPNTPSDSTASSSKSGGFGPGNPAASRALDDYLQKLQNLHDLMSLSQRDQQIQASVDQAESIARTQGANVTQDYIDKVKAAAGANYDWQQQIASNKALDDYLAKMQDLHDTMSLTARDQAVQQALDQAESIARSHDNELLQDYIDKVKAAAAANYDYKEEVQELTQVSHEFSSDVMNQFQQLTQGSETFGQALRSLALDFVNLLENMMVQQPLQQAFQNLLGGSGGLFTGGLSNTAAYGLNDLGYGNSAYDMIQNAPGFASGGQPPVNMPSIVGENGPELFIPNSAGTVVPNSALGSNTLHLTQNINFSTGVQATVRAEVMNMLPQIADASKAAVADGFLRGGKFAKALGG